MRVLDLYCGAGLASDGYAKAGWEVEGVDIRAQRHYPYRFHHRNAVMVLQTDLPERFDVIHASPPCQDFSTLANLRKAQGVLTTKGDLLTPTIAMLRERWSHKVWVVENVPGSPGMDGAIVLCGSQFFLDIRRHRLFLSNVPMQQPECAHLYQDEVWGVYYQPNTKMPGNGGKTARNVEHGRQLMGVKRPVPWDSLREGIPPVYTEYVAGQIRRALDERTRSA